MGFIMKIPGKPPKVRSRLRDLYAFMESAPVGTVIRAGKRGRIVGHKYKVGGVVYWWVSKNGKPKYL